MLVPRRRPVPRVVGLRRQPPEHVGQDGAVEGGRRRLARHGRLPVVGRRWPRPGRPHRLHGADVLPVRPSPRPVPHAAARRVAVGAGASRRRRQHAAARRRHRRTRRRRAHAAGARARSRARAQRERQHAAAPRGAARPRRNGRLPAERRRGRRRAQRRRPQRALHGHAAPLAAGRADPTRGRRHAEHGRPGRVRHARGRPIPREAGPAAVGRQAVQQRATADGRLPTDGQTATSRVGRHGARHRSTST